MSWYSNVDQSEVVFGKLLSFGEKVKGDDAYGDVHSRCLVNAGYIYFSGQVFPIFIVWKLYKGLDKCQLKP